MVKLGKTLEIDFKFVKITIKHQKLSYVYHQELIDRMNSVAYQE